MFDALYIVIKKSRYLPVSDTYFPSLDSRIRREAVRCRARWGVPRPTRFPESGDDMNRECEEVKELFALYYAGKLTDEQKAKLNLHLLFCPECVYQMVMLQAS
jgi:hypothetical protein